MYRIPVWLLTMMAFAFMIGCGVIASLLTLPRKIEETSGEIRLSSEQLRAKVDLYADLVRKTSKVA